MSPRPALALLFPISYQTGLPTLRIWKNRPGKSSGFFALNERTNYLPTNQRASAFSPRISRRAAPTREVTERDPAPKGGGVLTYTRTQPVLRIGIKWSIAPPALSSFVRPLSSRAGPRSGTKTSLTRRHEGTKEEQALKCLEPENQSTRKPVNQRTSQRVCPLRGIEALKRGHESRRQAQIRAA